MKPIPQSRIKTASGRLVDLERPTVDAIDIRDIAHALSQMNRFTGHTFRPYSVAEHSVVGSRFVPAEIGLEFLLHDATEAYLGDVSSPLKGLIGPKYAELEHAWAKVIARKFRLDERAAGQVKLIDQMMLEVELRVLVAPRTKRLTYATGGVVNPASSSYVVGERGSEAVLPATHAGALGSLIEARFGALREASQNPGARSANVREFEAETYLRERAHAAPGEFLATYRKLSADRFADLLGGAA